MGWAARRLANDPFVGPVLVSITRNYAVVKSCHNYRPQTILRFMYAFECCGGAESKHPLRRKSLLVMQDLLQPPRHLKNRAMTFLFSEGSSLKCPEGS